MCIRDRIDTSKPCLLWVTDFPQFEYSKEENRYMAMHHPFTAPRDEDVDKLVSDPGHVYAKAYDMVANGYELGGGSIRINDPDVQAKMFEALGFTPEQAEARFEMCIRDSQNVSAGRSVPRQGHRQSRRHEAAGRRPLALLRP